VTTKKYQKKGGGGAGPNPTPLVIAQEGLHTVLDFHSRQRPLVSPFGSCVVEEEGRENAEASGPNSLTAPDGKRLPAKEENRAYGGN